MKTGLKVGDCMTISPINVAPDDNLVGAVLVKNGKALVGIVTEQDIVRKAVKNSLNPATTKAGDIVEKEITTIEPDQDIFEALQILRKKNIRHLPVMHNNHLVGLLTVKDILKIQPQLFEIIVDML